MFLRPPARRLPQGSVIAASAEATSGQATAAYLPRDQLAVSATRRAKSGVNAVVEMARFMKLESVARSSAKPAVGRTAITDDREPEWSSAWPRSLKPATAASLLDGDKGTGIW